MNSEFVSLSFSVLFIGARTRNLWLTMSMKSDQDLLLLERFSFDEIISGTLQWRIRNKLFFFMAKCDILYINVPKDVTLSYSHPPTHMKSPFQTSIQVHFCVQFIPVLKWGASSRWSSSLNCHIRKSGQITIGKTHPTLILWKLYNMIYFVYIIFWKHKKRTCWKN